MKVLFDAKNGLDWEIENRRLERRFLIVFRLWGDMGEDTRDVRKIWYAEVSELGIKLQFTKITSPTWRDGLQSFVEALSVVFRPNGPTHDK